MHSTAPNSIEIRNQTVGSLYGSFLISPQKYGTRSGIYYPVALSPDQINQATLSHFCYQASDTSPHFKKRVYEHGMA
jgi:hypothetical protein